MPVTTNNCSCQKDIESLYTLIKQLQQQNETLKHRITKLEKEHATDFSIQKSSVLPHSAVSPLRTSCCKPAAKVMPVSSPLNLPNQPTNNTTSSQPSFLNSTAIPASQAPVSDKKDAYKKLIEGLTIGLDDPTPPQSQSMQERLSKDKSNKHSTVNLPDTELSSEQWSIAHQTHKTATSCKNFAALLMLNLFDHKDLVGRNCRGWKKPAIDKEKLDIVFSFCWKLYPSEMSGHNK